MYCGHSKHKHFKSPSWFDGTQRLTLNLEIYLNMQWKVLVHKWNKFGTKDKVT